MDGAVVAQLGKKNSEGVISGLLVSCIIATYKRDEWLARAVNSVLSQEFPGELELIVVNDSGEPLKYAPWQEDPRVTVITTQRVERCFAWNTAASVSRGDYLHILGDDDMLLPGAYAALLEVAEATGSALAYGAYEFMDDDGKVFTSIHPTATSNLFARSLVSGDVLLQASVVRREIFFEVGGFDPMLIPSEDLDLIARVGRCRPVAFTDKIVARMRFGITPGSTTPWHKVADMGRRMRDKFFCDPLGMRDILMSLGTETDGGVYGKLVRYYLGSAVRFCRYSPLTSVSRCIAAGRIARRGFVRPGFWRGLRPG